VPRTARFCPGCGTALTGGGPTALTGGGATGVAPGDGTLELPIRQPARFGRSFHRARPRSLGIELLPLLGAAEAAAAILTVLLFALGSWVAGIVLLVLTGALLVTFLAAARREPDSTLSRRALGGADRVQSLARLVLVGGTAAVRTGLRAVRVQQRRHRLRHELDRQLKPLGEAVYQGDDQRARAIKAQARRLERALAQTDRENAELFRHVRQELAEERAAVEATTQLPRPEPAIPDRARQLGRERVRT
jgi:hypothetical protein